MADQQQQGAEQGAGEELGIEVAQAGNQHHQPVQAGVALFLDQSHQALVECLQMRPAEQQGP
ncbi:hypothetical protein D3C78_1938180 [compost metagenome]